MPEDIRTRLDFIRCFFNASRHEFSITLINQTNQIETRYLNQDAPSGLAVHSYRLSYIFLSGLETNVNARCEKRAFSACSWQMDWITLIDFQLSVIYQLAARISSWR